MTAFQITLIIIAALVLLILLLLMLPIRLYLKASSRGAVFGVKLWFIPVFSTDGPKKKRKSKKKAQSGEKPKKEKKKRRFSEILELIEKLKGALEKAAPGLKLLFGKFKINKIHINAICAGEDAADTAMKYGILCSALYGVSGYINSLDKLSKTKTDVNVACDFTRSESDFELELVASIRVFWATKSLLKIIFASMNTITEVMNSGKQ